MPSTTVSTTRIAVDVAPPIVRVALRNPPLNVIDISMMEELAQFMAALEMRSDITVVVLHGEGKGFSAGVDVAAHTPDKVEEMLTKFHAVIRTLISTKKFTIAAVHGNCLGGGAELAMVCDMVYTAEDAQWGFPEIKLGCYPPVACAALAALVGQKRAADLIFSGRSISGKEAAEIGLATLACSGPPSSIVEEQLGHLLKLSPAALAITKKAFYAWDSIHFDKGLARAEKVYVEDLMKTTDAEEGVRAFVEKRAPKWTGR
jgi:cyclohexa-1,5-dienecarbonyl-CoA hydratase